MTPQAVFRGEWVKQGFSRVLHFLIIISKRYLHNYLILLIINTQTETSRKIDVVNFKAYLKYCLINVHKYLKLDMLQVGSLVLCIEAVLFSGR